MRKVNLRGMSNIRHAIEVMNSKVRRQGLTGAVNGVICGCDRDCGFARFQPSTSPPLVRHSSRFEPPESTPRKK